MARISIKPLSINKAYRGRRFATRDLHEYKKELTYLLPKFEVPSGNLKVAYEFGISSSGADGDNLIKCFQDCLGEIYGFNDNRIYEWSIKKVKVKKGEEYIDFNLTSC